jgi:hypothetical protein
VSNFDSNEASSIKVVNELFSSKLSGMWGTVRTWQSSR